MRVAAVSCLLQESFSPPHWAVVIIRYLHQILPYQHTWPAQQFWQVTDAAIGFLAVVCPTHAFQQDTLFPVRLPLSPCSVFPASFVQRMNQWTRCCTDISRWLRSASIQACFKRFKAGRCIIDLFKWTIAYAGQTCNNTVDEQTFHQHGIRPRDAQLSVPKLLEYVGGTVLDPQSAAPEDMAYFGSVCFQPCMQLFKSRVDTVQLCPGYQELLNAAGDYQGLSAFAACAGLPFCFDSCPTPQHLMHMEQSLIMS